MSFNLAKPKAHGAPASVSILSRCITAMQLNITFNRMIADRLGVTVGDRLACVVGVGIDSNSYALVVSPRGSKVRECGNKFIVRTACTGNHLLPHPARPFQIARFDDENHMVILCRNN